MSSFRVVVDVTTDELDRLLKLFAEVAVSVEERLPRSLSTSSEPKSGRAGWPKGRTTRETAPHAARSEPGISLHNPRSRYSNGGADG